jgi:hypothetical protein
MPSGDGVAVYTGLPSNGSGRSPGSMIYCAAESGGSVSMRWSRSPGWPATRCIWRSRKPLDPGVSG